MKILFFLLALFIPSPLWAVDPRLPTPEIAGNSIDEDLDGSIDEAVTLCFTADSADYYCEIESAQFVSPMASAADVDASGGNYVSLPSGNSFFAAQLRLPGTITSGTYYAWVRVKGAGRIWWDTSPIGRYPDNATLGATLPQRNVFTWEALGQAGSLANFTSGINGIAQRTVVLNGSIGISIMVEAGLQIDKVCISTSASRIAPGATDATLCSAGGTSIPDYNVLDIGTNAMPTPGGGIDSLWDQVPQVSYNGLNVGPMVGVPVTKMVWDKDASPKRFCLLHTYTLTGLTSVVTTDDTDISQDTAAYIYFKLTDLNRVVDSNTYLVGANMQTTPAVIDATWPSGVFDTTADLTNVTRGASYSGDILIIELCADLPGSPVADQLFLLNFRANERIGVLPETHRGAFNIAPIESYDIAGWGIGKLSTAIVPDPPPDTTDPVLTSCSAINIGSTSFQFRCTSNEAGSAIVRRDTDNDTPNLVSGADMVTTGAINCGATICTINVPGLTLATLYEVEMCLTDGAGNQGCSAVFEVTTSSSADKFVSSSGSNVNAPICPSGSPCALSRIPTNAQPGETWVVQNGTYGGGFHVDCAASGGTGAANGTVTQPITVRADNERQAFITWSLPDNPVSITNCAFWTIQGLRVEHSDIVGTNEANIVQVMNSNNITLRRNLVARNNRYVNGHPIYLDGTTNSLLEENEVYFFHRNGMLIRNAGNGNNIIRRNYINSRNHADIPGGFTSVGINSTKGDVCILVYPSSNNIFENNIAENCNDGMHNIDVTTGSDNNQWLGNISYLNDAGIGLAALGATYAGSVPINIYGENNFVQTFLDPNGLSGIAGYGIGITCKNCTMIGPGASLSTTGGLFISKDSQQPVEATGSFDCINCLSMNYTTSNGFIIDASVMPNFTLQSPAVFNNATHFSPAASDSRITGEVILGSNEMGTCKVWIPDSATSLKGTGVGGADRGANILYRYENGVLTTTPLWDVSTGNFPGGATVAGVNDVVGQSLFDVDSRLNVNTGGCLFPAGYGGGGGGPGPAPVAFEAATEFPTSGTGHASAASFTISHPGATPRGVLIFTVSNAAANTATAITYGGVNVPAVTGALAADTVTEPGSCRAWFVSSSSLPTGTQNVVVTRTNNAVAMWAAVITLTAGADLSVIGTPVLQQENGALSVATINSGTATAMRFACGYTGQTAVPGTGANSTMLHTMDFGASNFAAGVARETIAGAGSRSAGLTSGSDDRAGVTLAIGIP